MVWQEASNILDVDLLLLPSLWPSKRENQRKSTAGRDLETAAAPLLALQGCICFPGTNEQVEGSSTWSGKRPCAQSWGEGWPGTVWSSIWQSEELPLQECCSASLHQDSCPSTKIPKTPPIVDKKTGILATRGHSRGPATPCSRALTPRPSWLLSTPAC